MPAAGRGRLDVLGQRSAPSTGLDDRRAAGGPDGAPAFMRAPLATVHPRTRRSCHAGAAAFVDCSLGGWPDGLVVGHPRDRALDHPGQPRPARPDPRCGPIQCCLREMGQCIHRRRVTMLPATCAARRVHHDCVKWLSVAASRRPFQQAGVSIAKLASARSMSQRTRTGRLVGTMYELTGTPPRTPVAGKHCTQALG